MAISPLHTRKLTIIAQDPSVKVKGKILRTEVEIPAEELQPGPWGYRVQVVDYDSSTETLYKPLEYPPLDGANGDPFKRASDARLLSDPNFHAQNAYAIVMRILARFEFALGRRVSWNLYGHQIKVAPHAFAEANAFYSENDEALMFGYFPGRNGMVYTCLSHDIVAHETTHALLDGLRDRYTDPSSPEQAGFHEGFGDIVALLSVFSLPKVVETLIDLGPPRRNPDRIAEEFLTLEALRKSMLLGLAKEMGQELSAVRGSVLRRSVDLEPSRDYIKQKEFEEPHRRGEILVAAVLNAFLSVWVKRLEALGDIKGTFDRGRVVEEGATIADYLLTMVIRALDYAPPVNLEFCDFLSAVLTSDREINPNDSKYKFRETLLKSFLSYGIKPRSAGTASDPGIWLPPEGNISNERIRFDSLQRDRDEVFRFIWDNREALGLYDRAFSRVLSVRPCLRIGPDGFALRETVAEYMQIIDLQASELSRPLKVIKPKDMPNDQEVRLSGGGALIFNEYGNLKYHIHNRLTDSERQSQRIEYLWSYGYYRNPAAFRNFASLHRQRATSLSSFSREDW